MSNTILGLNSYEKLFQSSFKSYQSSPISNLMYGSAVSKLYSQSVAKQLKSNVSSYLSGLGSEANRVKNAAKPLLPHLKDSSYDRKSVVSSDSSAVTGTAEANSNVKECSVTVSKLALAQTNEGIKLNSKSPSSFEKGTNTFNLKAGSIEKNISFSINDSDTNKSSLEKMAYAINASKAGVKAEVISDDKAGTSQLRLIGEVTGKGTSFSLSDIRGNSVSAANANMIKQASQDAEYTLNNQKYSSSSNTVKLDGNISLTLKKAEGKEVSIKVSRDTNSIKNDIVNLADSLNSLITMSGMNSPVKSDRYSIIESLNSKKNELHKIGIEINSDNTLKVDTRKLDKALQEDISEVKTIISGHNGLAQSAVRLARDISSNPTGYLNRDGISQTTYSGRGGSNIKNAYAGLMIDMML